MIIREAIRREMQVKGKNKILAYILVIVMIIMGLTGCMSSNKTVAIINGEKISEPVYRICLWITQKYFESVTPGIWETDSVYGKTPVEYAKDRTLSSLKLSIAAKQKAEELGIKLTKTDQKAIKQQAKEYKQENQEFVKAFNIKQKDVEKFLTYNALIDKVIQNLGENYVPNAEELAQVIKEVKYEDETAMIQHILLSNRNEQGDVLPRDKDEAVKKLAEEILNKAINGENFESLVMAYSEDESVSDNQGLYTIARGDVDKALEEVAFEKGEVGQVYNQVVETAYGYEVVKVISRELLSEEEASSEALKIIRTEFASNELAKISETLKTEKLEEYDAITIMN